MKSKINAIVLSAFILTLVTLSYANQSVEPVVVTVPKSGSHLLTKVLEELLGKEAYWFHPIKPFELQNFNYDRKKYFLWGHPWPHKDLLQQMTQENIRGFFLIRHPYAILISSIFYAQATHPEIATGKSFDDLFMYYLNNPVHENHLDLFLTCQFGTLSLAKRYETFMLWSTLPNFLTIRFEDLVGSKGGGSDQKQKETLYHIAKHVGVNLTEERFREIQQKLFGGTVTFREGTIDSWKKYFDQKKLTVTNKHFSKLLSDLDYEEVHSLSNS